MFSVPEAVLGKMWKDVNIHKFKCFIYVILEIKYMNSLFLSTVMSERISTKIFTTVNWLSLVYGYSLILTLSSYFCIILIFFYWMVIQILNQDR